MDHSYLNNLHARIDNVLHDVTFGATSTTPPLRTNNRVLYEQSEMTNVVLWIIIGILIGIAICYVGMQSKDNDTDSESEENVGNYK